MKVALRDNQDFWSGVMLVAIGAAALVIGRNYPFGTSLRMGPGYFPMMLGLLLALIGLFVVFEAMVVETEDGEKIGSMAWRPLFFIIAANVVFGLMLGGLPKIGIPAMGLIVGIFALTFVASLAADTFRVKEVAILATVLALISYGAFILLLNLQFPVWPSFLTR